jgi:hypothetical protein
VFDFRVDLLSYFGHSSFLNNQHLKVNHVLNIWERWICSDFKLSLTQLFWAQFISEFGNTKHYKTEFCSNLEWIKTNIFFLNTCDDVAKKNDWPMVNKTSSQLPCSLMSEEELHLHQRHSISVLTTKPAPCNKVLVDKLTVTQLVKKFPAFYGTRRFITVFTTARHWSLPWATWINPHFH